MREAELVLVRSELEQALDADGNLSGEACAELCERVYAYTSRVRCELPDDFEPVGMADTDGASTDGEDVAIQCAWTEELCGVGRSHAIVRTPGRPRARTLTARWLTHATHAESASVLAFTALRRELKAHRAPDSFVARTLEFAADEVRHARLLGEIGRRHGGSLLRARRRPQPIRSLEAIAIENAIEGCVRETWSAVEAVHQARHADDPTLRSAMTTIAADEARHARLAWDLHAWLLRRSGRSTRRRLGETMAWAVRDLRARPRPAESDAARARLGLLSGRAASAMLETLQRHLWRPHPA